MGFRDLLAYQKAYKLALTIFEITQNFPIEEKYKELLAESEEVGKLLNYMMNNPDKFQ